MEQLKLKKYTIQLPGVEIRAYRSSAGDNYMGLAEASRSVGYSSIWLTQLCKKKSRPLIEMEKLGFTGEIVKGTVYVRNTNFYIKSQNCALYRVFAISIKDFIAVVFYAAGREKSQAKMLKQAFIEDKFYSSVATPEHSTGTITLHEVNGIAIPQRQEDGYVNATQLCRAGNKQIRDWKSLKSTRAYLEALSADIGIPVSDNHGLIQVHKGGEPGTKGTWVHPDVATELARQLSLTVPESWSRFTANGQTEK